MSNLWVSVEELDIYADHEYAYEAVKVASQLLWSMSGRKYGGINTVTEKYVCASRAYRLGASARNYTPELVAGGAQREISSTFAGSGCWSASMSSIVSAVPRSLVPSRASSV